jgi:hypothetical protein
MFIDGADCAIVRVNYSGAGGTNVTAQWTKATVNGSDCNTASGWAALDGGSPSGGGQNIDGTGDFWTTLSNLDCDTCIRVIIDATGEGCGIVEAKLFVPCCCNDTPSISESGTNATYEIKIYDDLEVVDKYNESAVVDSSAPRVTGFIKVLRDGIEVESTPFDEHLTTINVRRNIQANNSDPDYNVGAFVVSVKFGRSSNNTTFDIPLAPNTAVLSGVGGTTTPAALTYTGVNQDLMDAITIAINNYLGTLSLYTNVTVTFGPNGINIATDCRHNATDNYCGIQDGDEEFIWEQDNGVQYVTTAAGGNNSGASVQFNSNAAPCGILSTRLTVLAFNISISNSSHDLVAVTNANPDVIYDNVNLTPIRVCAEHILTVINACVGATYLWSTGAVTDSITVPAGSYSVQVTCPDGCVYNLNIDV